MDKVTADVGKMMVQVPALFETLAGINFQDFMKRLPQVGGAQRGGNGDKKVTTDDKSVDGEA